MPPKNIKHGVPEPTQEQKLVLERINKEAERSSTRCVKILRNMLELMDTGEYLLVPGDFVREVLHTVHCDGEEMDKVRNTYVAKLDAVTSNKVLDGVDLNKHDKAECTKVAVHYRWW